MRHVTADDPAELIVAWEAVEELLAAVPDGAGRDVLRLVAAGLEPEEIAQRLGMAPSDVQRLVARGRIRVLTAAVTGAPASRSGPAAPR